MEPNQSSHSSLSLSRRFLSVPTLISFIVAGALLLFLATRSSVDLTATWQTLRNSNIALFVAAALVHYTTFFFRGARWRLMLHNAEVTGEGSLLTQLTSARLMLLGWFASSITWFSLGDAYRAYAYYEETGAPLARSMGTILSERVMDIIVVFLILLTGFMFLSLDPETRPSNVFLQVGFLLVVAFLTLILMMQLMWKRGSRFLPGMIRSRYAAFHEGTMQSFRTFPVVMLLGLLGWLSEVGRLYLVVQTTGLEVGIGLVMFVTVANALLSAVPLTPGGLGVVETGITGLLMLSLAQSDAISVALLDRSISYVSVIILGIVSLIYHRRVVARRKSPNNGGRQNLSR